jgi:hypothetical protein
MKTMALSIGIVLVCVLLFLAVNKPRSSTAQPLMQNPVPMLFPATQQPVQMSIRQQQLDEESTEISAAFRDKANEAWRSEVISKASKLLAKG